MGNYSIKNVFTKEPVAIAGAIRSVIYVLVLLGVVTLNAPQLAGIALALELGLGLFARHNSTPTSDPSLTEGTPVKNPAAPDGDTPPPDLVVADAALVIDPALLGPDHPRSPLATPPEPA